MLGLRIIFFVLDADILAGTTIGVELCLEGWFLGLLFLQLYLAFLYMHSPFGWRGRGAQLGSWNRWRISNVAVSCRWDLSLGYDIEHDRCDFSPRLLLLLRVFLYHFVKVTHRHIRGLARHLSLQHAHLNGLLVSKQRCTECRALCWRRLRGIFLFRTLTCLYRMKLLVPSVSFRLRLELLKFRKLRLLVRTLLWRSFLSH